MLIALPLKVIAQVEPSTIIVRPSVAQPVVSATLDSPAQVAMRQLNSKDASPRMPRPSNEAKIHPDLITRLEEIRVYGRNEPEDFVGPTLSPLMQFRARLENDVPLSPAKKTQRALCFIGLCSIYGPEGIPLGDSPERRAEARLVQSTVQSLSAPY